MSEWTKHPEATGAYWFQIKGAKPDIVWVHQGRCWGVIGGWRPVREDASYGDMLFYGPLDLPPPMPEEGGER